MTRSTAATGAQLLQRFTQAASSFAKPRSDVKIFKGIMVKPFSSIFVRSFEISFLFNNNTLSRLASWL